MEDLMIHPTTIPAEMLTEVFWKLMSIMIVTLLAIIAYFLRNFHHDIKSMKEVIIQMQLNNAAQTAANKAFSRNWDKSTDKIDTRLDDHGKRLDRHGVEIQILKSKTS